MGFIFTHFDTKGNGIGKYEFIQVSTETLIVTSFRFEIEKFILEDKKMNSVNIVRKRRFTRG